MSFASILFFYISTFFISGLLAVPIGPVNLEVFHTALKKHYPQAVSVALGGATGDAIWALSGFYGISPFMSHRYLEASFLFITSIITFVLGIFALKNSKFIVKSEEKIVRKIRRKRWALLKGLTLVLVNPLGIVSWMITLSFLRKFNLYIPMSLNYVLIFFMVVLAGAFAYFCLIVFITHRMKRIFSPERTRKITNILGYLLFACSVYFLFYAIKIFFLNGSLYVPK